MGRRRPGRAVGAGTLNTLRRVYPRVFDVHDHHTSSFLHIHEDFDRYNPAAYMPFVVRV